MLLFTVCSSLLTREHVEKNLFSKTDRYTENITLLTHFDSPIHRIQYTCLLPVKQWVIVHINFIKYFQTGKDYVYLEVEYNSLLKDALTLLNVVYARIRLTIFDDGHHVRSNDHSAISSWRVLSCYMYDAHNNGMYYFTITPKFSSHRGGGCFVGAGNLSATTKSSQHLAHYLTATSRISWSVCFKQICIGTNVFNSKLCHSWSRNRCFVCWTAKFSRSVNRGIIALFIICFCKCLCGIFPDSVLWTTPVNQLTLNTHYVCEGF